MVIAIGSVTSVPALVEGDDKNEVEESGDDDSVWEDVNSSDEEEEVEEENDEDSNSKDDDKTLSAEQLDMLAGRTVSYQLQARLLNICSSICYLIGDATKAVQCLRLSAQCSRNAARLSTDRQAPASYLHLDESGTISSPLGELIPFLDTSTSSSSLSSVGPERCLLLDTYVKLGSLLSDMDEVEEAHELFQLALKIDPRSAPALTHSAENEIQKSNFEGALQLLLKAKQSAQSDQVTMRLHKLKVATSQLFGNNANGQVSSSLSSLQQAQVVERIGQEAQQNLLSSVISLLALSRFRVSPTSPEVSS